jgi:hypothetical protein
MVNDYFDSGSVSNKFLFYSENSDSDNSSILYFLLIDNYYFIPSSFITNLHSRLMFSII